MDQTLKKIADLHNQLSDRDYIWFPFVFLRPKPDKIITTSRIAIMAPCFAVYFTLAYIIRNLFVGRAIVTEDLVSVLGWSCLGFFVWFHLVTAYFWNLRVRKMSELSAESVLNKGVTPLTKPADVIERSV